jgi:hypothetical protein
VEAAVLRSNRCALALIVAFSAALITPALATGDVVDNSPRLVGTIEWAYSNETFRPDQNGDLQPSGSNESSGEFAASLRQAGTVWNDDGTSTLSVRARNEASFTSEAAGQPCSVATSSSVAFDQLTLAQYIQATGRATAFFRVLRYPPAPGTPVGLNISPATLLLESPYVTYADSSTCPTQPASAVGWFLPGSLGTNLDSVAALIGSLVDDGIPDPGRRVTFQRSASLTSDNGRRRENLQVTGTLRLTPTVEFTVPASGQSNVPRDARVRVAFSRPMNAGSLNAESLRIVNPQGEQLAGTISYDPQSWLVDFTPSQPLTGGTHTATVKNTVEAIDGARLRADYSWAFTVQAGGPPVASFSYTPHDPVERAITFDASASTGESDITRYDWLFGDGTTLQTSQPIAVHRYERSGKRTVTLTVVDEQGTSSSPLAMEVDLPHRHYVIEARTWIPQKQIVNPFQPIPLPRVVAPSRCANDDLLPIGARVETTYRGDDHLGFDGSSRVGSRLEFDWDGVEILNASSSPSFGTTHLDFRYFVGTRLVGACQASATATRLAEAVTVDNSFFVNIASANPLVPVGAVTPDVDADYWGFVSAEGDVTVNYLTDRFPAHGVRVIREGVVLGTNVVMNPSCTTVLGVPGARELAVRFNAQINSGALAFVAGSSRSEIIALCS